MEVVETTVEIGGLALSLVHPPDAEELIDEEAFEHEEFLPVLGRAVAERRRAGARARRARSSTAGRVLELGCGLALPSIVAALRRRPRHSPATGRPTRCRSRPATPRDNGVELDTRLAAWERPAPSSSGGPWPLVVAADVLYERRNVEPLLELLPRLGREVLLADPGRPALRAFLDGAEEGWRVEVAAAPELPRGGVHRLLRR